MYLSSQGIVEAFTRTIGLVTPDDQASGPLVLVFEQKWVVNIVEANHSVVLYASPGKLDTGCLSGEPDWTCLSGDMAGITHIGKDPATGLVMLHSKADAAELNAVSFQAWLEQFLVMLEHWSALLSAEDSKPRTQRCASPFLHHALA